MPPYTDANLKVVEEILSLSIFKAPLERDLASLAEAGATTIHRLNFAYVGFFTTGDLFRLTPGKLFLNMFGRCGHYLKFFLFAFVKSLICMSPHWGGYCYLLLCLQKTLYNDP